MKTTTLPQFLSTAEILRCAELREAKKICTEVIEPNIERINKALGQENDPMYLGYAVEFVLSQVRRKENDY